MKAAGSGWEGGRATLGRDGGTSLWEDVFMIVQGTRVLWWEKEKDLLDDKVYNIIFLTLSLAEFKPSSLFPLP